MTKRKKRVFTKDWERLIWRPFGRFIKLIGLSVMLQVGVAISAITIAIYMLLGLLWFLSLGHLDYVKSWDKSLDKYLRPFLVGKVGRTYITLLGGWN